MNATKHDAEKPRKSLSIVIASTICMCMLFTGFKFPANAQVKFVRIAEFIYTNVTDVNWSPDGSRFAIVDFPSLHILDSTTWEPLLTIPDSGVSHVAWNSDGTRIASVAGGNPSSLYIWDSVTGACLQHLTIDYPSVVGGVFPMYQLAWSSNDRIIASDSYATDILIWDTYSEDVSVLGSHDSGRVTEVDFSPQSDRIVSTGSDGTVRIWDVDSGELVSATEGGKSVDWHPAQDRILASSGSTAAFVLSADSGNRLMTMEHESRVVLARWNFDGTLAAVSDENEIVRIWDIGTGNIMGDIANAFDLNIALTWHPERNVLAIASYDGRISIWQIIDIP
ncbi:MAG: hypothetical protein KC547_06145 [Anaerolineae bacterium]|nr:hypothetical protein [Anaerolineae bacterium]